MKTLDVNEVIDNARFTRFHWMVMCLCALLLILMATTCLSSASCYLHL